MEQVVIADLNNAAHADAVLLLLNEYAKDEMGGGTGLSEFARQNLIPALQSRPGMFSVLAFAEAQPVGLAICVEGFSTFACKPLINIHDIVVSHAFRGRGISRRILAKVEEQAIERGCCKLTLEVLEGNKIAQSAYKSFGFDGYELNPETGKALFWQKLLP